MRPLAVTGSAPEVSATVDRLATRLARDGRVAVVARDPSAPGADPDVATRYTLDDGRWHATGSGGLDDVLDRLAPDHDYAVLRGVDAAIPQVRVGGQSDDRAPRDQRGDRTQEDVTVLATADDAASLDLDGVVGALGAVHPHVTLESLVREVKRSPDADRAGAIATFTGRVRTRDGPEDPPTEFLEFEAHEDLAERRLDDLRADLEAREGVWAVRLHHRRGVVKAGEDIVFVVVLAGHRTEAFRAVEDGIDRLKREVPLFKREVTATEEFWAHERDTPGGE